MLQNADIDSSGRYYYRMQDGSVIHFTVDPKLQSTLNTLLATYPEEYQGLALIDARSGKVLAIGGRFEGKPSLRSFKMNDYPAASIFKVVTAIASMKYIGLEPYDTLPFCGPIYRRRPKRWLKCRYEPERTSFALAFGRSINPVFGRLSVRLGKDAIKEVASFFHFNDTLLGLPMGYVAWDSVNTEEDLALLGSGFAYSYLNPIQAILIGEAMATGLMWVPYVVDYIEKDGEIIYRSTPSLLNVPLERDVVRNLREIAQMTVDSGTVRKIFYSSDTSKLVPVGVGGKTGTLTSRKYKALTKWFVGFSPLDDPDVVVVSFAMGGGYHLRTSYLAMRLLQAYYIGRFEGVPMAYKKGAKSYKSGGGF